MARSPASPWMAPRLSSLTHYEKMISSDRVLPGSKTGFRGVALGTSALVELLRRAHTRMPTGGLCRSFKGKPDRRFALKRVCPPAPRPTVEKNLPGQFWTGFGVHAVGVWGQNVAQKGPTGGGALLGQIWSQRYGPQCRSKNCPRKISSEPRSTVT